MTARDDRSRISWDDCLKIARVNVLTGAYEMVMQMGTAYEQACARTSTIFALMQTAVDLGLIYRGDRSIVQACLDKDSFARLLDQPRPRVTASFRVCLDGCYEWTTLEIVFPADFSVADPEALFVLRRAEMDRHRLETAMCRLACDFHKILRVDLTGDSFEPIRLTGDERSDAAHMDRISSWFGAFTAAGYVLPTDMRTFMNFTSLPRLRLAFRNGAERVSCRYRRRCGQTFHWVQMELLRDDDYTDARQTVMLYIRDLREQEPPSQLGEEKGSDAFGLTGDSAQESQRTDNSVFQMSDTKYRCQ